ncbi:MAG: hypothetical protein ACE5FJ_11795, partial [Gemmatimonadales bacterium]
PGLQLEGLKGLLNLFGKHEPSWRFNLLRATLAPLLAIRLAWYRVSNQRDLAHSAREVLRLAVTGAVTRNRNS